MTSTCLSQFEDGEFFDYNCWTPADEYRPLTPTPSVSSSGSSKSSVAGDPEPVEQDLAGAFADKVNPTDAKSRFKQLANGGSEMPTSKGSELARSLGLAPSKADQDRLVQQHPKTATYDEMQEWLISVSHPEDDVEHLCQFFKQYDSMNKGKLTKTQMRNILCEMGDKMTIAEVDKVLSSAGQSGEEVDYRAVCTKLLQK